MSRLIVLQIVLGWLLGVLGNAQEPRVVTSVREIREMSAAEAAKNYPVRVRGTIIYHDPLRKVMWVHNGDDSVFVRVRKENLPERPVVSGMQVEMEGVTDPGLFMPIIRGALRSDSGPKITILGEGPLPPPRKITAGDLLQRELASQWVEVEGVIKTAFSEANCTAFELDIGGTRVTALFPEVPTVPLPWHLVEARVRVRAVLSTVSNLQRQRTGNVLYVPSLEHVTALQTFEEVIGELPIQPIGELLAYSHNSSRVRVQGVISSLAGGKGFYLRGQGGGVWVEGGEPLNVSPGTVMDVVGIAKVAVFKPVLRATKAHIIGRQNPPQPLPVTAAEIYKGAYHAELVSIKATLLAVQWLEGRVILRLRHGQHFFNAQLNTQPDAKPFQALQPESEVQVVGVCSLLTTRPLAVPQRPDAFILEMSSERDVAVLHTPPFWTTPRVAYALAGVAALALAALAWGMALRRQVRAQTEVIHSQLERATIQKERMRIARDLHDDLGAGLTRIGYLSARAVREGASPGEVREQIETMRDASREVVRALDAAVWAVNPNKDSLPQFVTYLCQFAGDLFRASPIRCRVDVSEPVADHPLKVEVRHQFFLAAKEVLNNAARHSAAREIWLRIAVRDAVVHVRVEDDGTGFDPEPAESRQRGLSNIRRRMEDISGSFKIVSRPGAGTSVELILPLT